MNKQFISILHIINIVAQAFFTLLFQIAVFFLIAWLAVSRIGWPEWVYAPFILVGALSGLISMIKFILCATRSLEAIEAMHNERRKSDANQKKKDFKNED